MRSAFLTAFSRFPDYSFVWKFDGTMEVELPPNVHLFKWVTQKAMLQHPKLRVFITHCGLNSLNEAVVAGVPMVAVPLFADQLYNAAMVHVRRVGVYLDITRAEDARVIEEALSEVLHNGM